MATVTEDNNTIRIFIASSSELEDDRDEFRKFLSIENDTLHKKGVYLQLVQWENFLDAVSQSRLQNEYNEALKKCDIVICLFYAKAGKYTQEEFDVALRQFRETGRPLIYTYFKSGAPAVDSVDESSLALIKFKERLASIGHFYTSYDGIRDLKLQFRKQLDMLEERGFIVLRDDIRKRTADAVADYFNNTNTATANGNSNIVIQGVNESSIIVNVNGHSQELEKKVDVLLDLVKQQGLKTVELGDSVYKIETISDANFDFLLGQVGRAKSLPTELGQNLLGEGNDWIQSLRQELQVRQRIAVGNQPWNIFQNYGWLVETFLQKMGTLAGQAKTLRRLSFMAEAYQATVRYLCYIQVAQILRQEKKPKLDIVSAFIQMEGDGFIGFDYISLLLTATDAVGGDIFMPEIGNFVSELRDTESALYSTALYLNDQRRRLLANSIKEDGELPHLLDKYLRALVYWLRKISFLSKYRLVSIKEINLDYRLGTAKNFVHLYGELHGLYGEISSNANDYNAVAIEDVFTFNKSVLLFRGHDVSSGMRRLQEVNTYLSLSPLLIDQSVYADKPTQTPEIFYYTGFDKSKRQFNYAQYKNELAYDGKDIVSNKSLKVLAQNINLPRLDELFEQLDELFRPLKSTQP